VAGRGQHGGRSRGVGAAGVQQNRDAHRAEKHPCHFLQQSLARRDIRPADENRRLMQILGAPSEDGPMHQIAHLIRLDARILQQVIHPGIDRDHGVKNAAVRVGIQLDQDLRFAHQKPLNGC
jgi:hypothetical protein